MNLCTGQLPCALNIQKLQQSTACRVVILEGGGFGTCLGMYLGLIGQMAMQGPLRMAAPAPQHLT